MLRHFEKQVAGGFGGFGNQNNSVVICVLMLAVWVVLAVVLAVVIGGFDIRRASKKHQNAWTITKPQMV